MKLEFRQTVTCNHLTLARVCKSIDWQQPLPRCGEYVAGLDTLDGEQELPVRKLLHRAQDGSCLAELPGFNIAQLRLSYRELEQLERIHAAFVDACGRNDGTDAITQDSLFHDAIVRGAHNEYVEEFSHTMILHIQRIKYHYFHCDRLRKISVSQHGEILQTIQARDSARAKELMRSHWLCSMENSLRDVAGMIHGVGGESGQDVLTK